MLSYDVTLKADSDKGEVDMNSEKGEPEPFGGRVDLYASGLLIADTPSPRGGALTS